MLNNKNLQKNLGRRGVQPTRNLSPFLKSAHGPLFSAAGQIYSDRRSLLRENAEKLLFFAYNIRLFNYDY